MKKYMRLYIKFVAQYVKALMEYKVDFYIGLAGFFVIQMSGIAFLYLIFQRIPQLNGWSFDQILFIYGFSQLPRGVDHLFTDNLWIFSQRIVVRGEFDRYLLRPMDPLFQLLAERFQTDALGELIVGALLVGISMARLNLSFTLIQWLLFISLILCGAVIYTAIKLFFGSFAFWIKFSQAIVYLAYTLSDFAKYPIGIYSKVIQGVITFVVPFAFTAFFPASYFVGKMNLQIAAGGTFVTAVLSFTVAYMTWLRGMQVYESAGN